MIFFLVISEKVRLKFECYSCDINKYFIVMFILLYLLEDEIDVVLFVCWDYYYIIFKVFLWVCEFYVFLLLGCCGFLYG